MRCSVRIMAVGILVALFLVGCEDGETANPVWKAMCEATCAQGVYCPGFPVEGCASACLNEIGNEPCKGDVPALQACVADIEMMSCDELSRGELPESCDDVCLCQGMDDCDDGNECTTGMCDVESGKCEVAPVPEETPCAGDIGGCQQGLCVVPCNEEGIRAAVVTGGHYAFACSGPTKVTTLAEIIIEKDVVLDGGGDLIVDADGRHRVFSVSAEPGPTVELRNLTVIGGGGTDVGGGIHNSGTLTLTGCILGAVCTTATR